MAKKLLIVDDSINMRGIIRKVAESIEFEVVGEAADGVAAIDLFKERQPEYVTMDITMPKLDGLAALQRMMAINPEAKVLMITAYSSPDKAIQALGLGARATLEKPIKLEILSEALKELG